MRSCSWQAFELPQSWPVLLIDDGLHHVSSERRVLDYLQYDRQEIWTLHLLPAPRQTLYSVSVGATTVAGLRLPMQASFQISGTSVQSGTEILLQQTHLELEGTNHGDLYAWCCCKVKYRRKRVLEHTTCSKGLATCPPLANSSHHDACTMGR
jgi:hypothetical protein